MGIEEANQEEMNSIIQKWVDSISFTPKDLHWHKEVAKDMGVENTDGMDIKGVLKKVINRGSKVAGNDNPTLEV